MEKFLLVFALYFLMDWFWAGYIDAIGKEKALPAALWSITLTGMSIASTIAIVDAPYLAGAAIAGGFAGTIAFMKLSKKFNLFGKGKKKDE